MAGTPTLSDEAGPPAPGGCKPKRGPGRPPKKQYPPPLRRDGVVESPTDANHRLEFVYEDPSMIKSLFLYFKNLKSVDIHIRCTPEGLSFFTRDAAKMCRVVAEIPGTSLNHYYCDTAFWLGLNRENVERIFSSIDKSFFKVTILHRHDDPDNLNILFKDPEIDKECSYRVTVSSVEVDEDLLAAEAHTTPAALKAFPVEFQLTSKQFKKTVTDVSHFSDVLCFSKLGGHPLQLTFNNVGLAYSEVYRNPEKINLRSEVKDGEIFHCTVSVANVKSLAAAMVTDTVRIFCRENDDLLFRSEIDAMVVSTLTRIG
jgi:hypothetical protein